MIGFAFAATTLNYVQRLSFTYLSAHPDLRALFGDAAFGTLGTAFFVAYTLSNGVSGSAIDRLGTRSGAALRNTRCRLPLCREHRLGDGGRRRITIATGSEHPVRVPSRRGACR